MDPDFLPVKDCVDTRLKKVSEVEKLFSDALRSLAVWKLVGFLKNFRSIYLLIKLLLSIHMYRMETIIISQVPNFSSLILSDLYKCGI